MGIHIPAVQSKGGSENTLTAPNVLYGGDFGDSSGTNVSVTHVAKLLPVFHLTVQPLYKCNYGYYYYTLEYKVKHWS